MKCTNRVYYGWVSEKSRDKGTKPKKLGDSWLPEDFVIRWVIDRVVECDGEIRFEVVPDEEPNWGGSYPVVKVEGKCPKCKDTFWAHLVERNLNQIVNDALNVKHVRDYELDYRKEFEND